MADRTLTINHADGDSETYTINRDKFAGVREMSRGHVYPTIAVGSFNSAGVVFQKLPIGNADEKTFTVVASNSTAIRWINLINVNNGIRTGKHRMEFDLVLNSGSISSGFSWNYSDNDDDPYTGNGYGSASRPTVGHNSFDFEIFNDGVSPNPHVYFQINAGSTFDISVTNFKITHEPSTVTADHTATPKAQSKETTFGGSKSITIKRDIEPLLSEVVGGASAAYSLRDLNDKAGNSKVVRVRRASDHCERDFRAKEVKDIAKWVNTQTVPPLDLQELDADGHRTGATITAAAAYSLRNLSSTYTGNVVDVRRSSDDAEESFTAAEVADGTLTGWVGPAEWDDSASVDSTGDWEAIDSTISHSVDKYVLTYTANTQWAILNTAPNLINNNPVTISVDVKNGTSGNAAVYLGASIVGGGNQTLGQIGATSDSWQTLTATLNASSNTFDKPSIRFDMTSGTVEFKNFTVSQGNDGFVSQWYDQSGNGNHATQGTDASQPKIVDGGSLVSGGLEFDGVDDGLFTSSNLTDTIQSATIFALTQDGVTSGTASMVRIRTNGNFGNFDGFVWEKTTSDTYGANTFIEGANGVVSTATGGQGTRNTSKNLNTLVYQQSQILAYENGAIDETLNDVPIGSTPVGDVTLVDQLWIGQNFDDNARPFNGTMSEVIIYFTDQSANREAIEANINNQYDIY